MLPLVGSTMVVPGGSRPASSAASIIETAIRSLTLPAGLKNSSLAAIRAPAPSVDVSEADEWRAPDELGDVVRDPHTGHLSPVAGRPSIRRLCLRTQRIGCGGPAVRKPDPTVSCPSGADPPLHPPHLAPEDEGPQVAFVDEQIVEHGVEVLRSGHLHVVLPQQDLRRAHTQSTGQPPPSCACESSSTRRACRPTSVASRLCETPGTGDRSVGRGWTLPAPVLPVVPASPPPWGHAAPRPRNGRRTTNPR